MHPNPNKSDITWACYYTMCDKKIVDKEIGIGGRRIIGPPCRHRPPDTTPPDCVRLTHLSKCICSIYVVVLSGYMGRVLTFNAAGPRINSQRRHWVDSCARYIEVGVRKGALELLLVGGEVKT